MIDLNKEKNNFLKEMKNKYGSLFTYEKLDYKDKNTMVILTCIKNGDFHAFPSIMLRRESKLCLCVICLRNRHFEEFKILARKIHGDKYSYDKCNFINATTKIEITCKKHGAFYQEPYMHYGKKQGCPKCARERDKLTQEDFIISASIKHKNKYDYSQTIYTKVSDYINIICPTHGLFNQRAGSHLYGNGCSKCTTEKSRLGIKNFILISSIKHNHKYDYKDVVYLGNKKKVEIICPKHGKFNQKPNAHMSGAGCPKCISSKGENEIERILSACKINFTREYTIPDGMNKYRYDFFLRDLNILVEFHGHQHYLPVDRFGGVKGHIECVKRDRAKRLLAKEHNIPLIEIHYSFLYNKKLEKKLLKEIKKCQKNQLL